MTLKTGHGYEKEIEVALGAVREAARLCREVQAGIAPDALEKKDRSPVTIADFGAQALVCRALDSVFDDPIIAEEDSKALGESENHHLLERLTEHVHRILGPVTREELCGWIDRGGAGSYSDRFWTLDPIDGTKGFLRGDQYAISLALIEEGSLVVSALCCPNLLVDPEKPAARGCIFFAIRGAGAFSMPLDEEADPKPIRTSEIDDTTMIRFCESVEAAHSSHGDAAAIAHRLGIVAKPVRIDSQAKYAVVARGEGDAYLRLPKGTEYREKIWDHAGGVLIVNEAGGRVTDINGRPLVFTHGKTLDENRGVIVSNGLVHEAILGAIRDLEMGAVKQ